MTCDKRAELRPAQRRARPGDLHEGTSPIGPQKCTHVRTTIARHHRQPRRWVAVIERLTAVKQSSVDCLTATGEHGHPGTQPRFSIGGRASAARTMRTRSTRGTGLTRAAPEGSFMIIGVSLLDDSPGRNDMTNTGARRLPGAEEPLKPRRNP